MKQPDPETRFLAAIAHAATDRFSADHPLAVAAKKGAKAPQDAAAVHELLAGLPEADRDAILAAAHRQMREDVAAIWSFLPSAAGSGTMH